MTDGTKFVELTTRNKAITILADDGADDQQKRQEAEGGGTHLDARLWWQLNYLVVPTAKFGC